MNDKINAVGVGGSSAPEVIAGVRFSVRTLNATVDTLVGMVDENAAATYFACVNPHSVMQARRDREFFTALEKSSLNTADGVGIVLASRLLGGFARERVCGPDIFERVCAKLNHQRAGTRMFFLGTTEDTLRLLSARFATDFPNLIVAGTLAPPFRAEFTSQDEEMMIDVINGSRAEVLWLGLGAPKQEKLALRLRDRLKVRLIAPVGGVFDFYTGRVKLPPMWMQRAGLIWFYRWCQQPRRLFRRNLDAPIFLALVLWQRLTKGRVNGGR